MSCDECDKIQELNIKGKSIGLIRFGNKEIGYGNIQIGACDKHFNLIRQKLLDTDEEIEITRMNIASLS